MCAMWNPYATGNYGNQIDGMNKSSSSKKKKKDGEEEEEENELIQNSSEDEADEDGDLASVSSTPFMKPVITDRSGVKHHKIRYQSDDDWICHSTIGN